MAAMITILAVLAATLGAWLEIASKLRRMPTIEMDAVEMRGGASLLADHRHNAYLAALIATVLFLISLHLRLPVPAALLAMSVLYAVLFCAWTALCYEHYMHLRYPPDAQRGHSPYTGAKYALTIVLGYGSMILLVAGTMALLVEAL